MGLQRNLRAAVPRVACRARPDPVRVGVLMKLLRRILAFFRRRPRDLRDETPLGRMAKLNMMMTTVKK